MTRNNLMAALRPRRLAAGGLLALALLGLGGCASGPNANPRDPLEPLNRSVAQFNDGVDAVVLKPAATVYQRAVPALVRTGVSNFFSNLGDAWSLVNNALQLKVQYAGESFIRLGVNTLFGLGGVLDVASEMNIERHKEDFGQTLGYWGVPAGPYLVLPLLGSSTLRDTAALSVDGQIDPVRHVNDASDRNGLYVLRAVDARANLLRVTSMLDEVALDKYSFTRDAYLQRRRALIYEGNETEPPSPPDDAGQPAPDAKR